MERRDLTSGGDPIALCPACGAIAPAGAVACPACGEPVAATGEDAPLPPLPDGGLAALMPAWLRDAPASDGGPGDSASAGPSPDRVDLGVARSVSSKGAAIPSPASAAPPFPSTGLGAEPVDTVARVHAPGPARAGSPPGTAATFDPASVISADDLPAWLRAIGGASAGSPALPAAPPGEALPEAASLSEADMPAAPVYLPRVEALPVVSVTDAVNATGSSAGPDTIVAAAEPDRAGNTDLADDLPEVAPSAAAAPTPGDDGAPPAMPAERGEPSTAARTATEDPDAAVAAAGTAIQPVSAERDAIAADPPHRDGARGPLPEGVAAGIATIAIMIVAAAILFLIWRALAAQ